MPTTVKTPVGEATGTLKLDRNDTREVLSDVSEAYPTHVERAQTNGTRYYSGCEQRYGELRPGAKHLRALAQNMREGSGRGAPRRGRVA